MLNPNKFWVKRFCPTMRASQERKWCFKTKTTLITASICSHTCACMYCHINFWAITIWHWHDIVHYLTWNNYDSSIKIKLQCAQVWERNYNKTNRYCLDNSCVYLSMHGVVVILVSISLAMSPRPRAGDLRASIRADQEGWGSVWVNQCSSIPVKQAPATSRWLCWISCGKKITA